MIVDFKREGGKARETEVEYQIARRVLGDTRSIAITKEEFEEALLCRDKFFEALGIEEKFDLVAENYSEFEQEIMRLTMASMLFLDFTWSSARTDRSLVNRRLANLLSACRLYVDHTKHDIAAIYGNESPTYCALCSAFSREYDNRFGYAIMEALRNHTQHKGLPLYGLKYTSTRKFPGNEDAKLRKYTCVPTISLNGLRAEGALDKAPLLSRLPADDELDLRPLVRDYVAGLGAAHVELRTAMSGDIESWRGVLEGVRNRFLREHGEPEIGLAVIERGERGVHVRSAAVFPEFIDEYSRLVRKNRFPQSYATQFVSGDTF
jgi:hypothetical protein